jgi:uncharacterized protein YndB with AHSA1/START domain
MTNPDPIIVRSLQAPPAVVWWAFSWQWDGETTESLVGIELTETARDETRLVLSHRGLDDGAREDHAKGWSDCPDRLAAGQGLP